MGKNAALFGGNWDNTSNSGSRASNWNNSPTNSNNNIGVRGVCEGNKKVETPLCRRYGAAGRPFILWSAMLSCFGKHPWGSGRAPSSHRVVTNGAASFCHG
jgi:hypothetical protein